MTVTLDDVYALLPRIECQKKCHDSCGPISMTHAEFVRMTRAHGSPLPEVNVYQFEEDEPGGQRNELRCGLLKDNLCSIYADRPLICRLWGVAKELPCPFGCQPERSLTDEEVTEIFALLGQVRGNEKLRLHHMLPRNAHRAFMGVARKVRLTGESQELKLDVG